MAEIGLIASVIQVAGAGLTLSNTLYQYADSVSSADKRIRDIAQDVKLTSFVIDELGSIFKQDETAALISKNAVNTAEETVRECSNVFTEMEAALKKSKKNTLGRLMLPFREPKLELLRTNIDRLKSTLQLLMQVLTHAHQIAAQKPDKDVVALQRQQIKVLIQTKKESTKIYEESLRNYSMSDGSIAVNDDDDLSTETNDEKNEATDRSIATFETASSIGTTITAKSLESCVDHIQKLLKDIETVQRALSANIDDTNSTEHEQDLIGSYFRTRSALDSVILGSSSAAKAGSGLGEVTLPKIGQFSSVSIEEEREERIRLQKIQTYSKGPEPDPKSDEEKKLLTEKVKEEDMYRWPSSALLQDTGLMDTTAHPASAKQDQKALAGQRLHYDENYYESQNDHESDNYYDNRVKENWKIYYSYKERHKYAGLEEKGYALSDSEDFSDFTMRSDMARAADMDYYGRGDERQNSNIQAHMPAMSSGRAEIEAKREKLKAVRDEREKRHQERGARVEALNQDISPLISNRLSSTVTLADETSESDQKIDTSTAINVTYEAPTTDTKHTNDITTPPTGLARLDSAAGRRNTNNTTVIEDRRSRSRRRRSSVSVVSDDERARSTSKHRDLEHRNRRVAQAGLATAAVAGLVEHARSKSPGLRGISRSRSRIRQGVPIAAAGLAGAAVTGLYERHQAKKEEKEERSRSKSRSRSVPSGRRHGTPSDAALVEYGGEPIYTDPVASTYRRRSSDPAGYRSRRRGSSESSEGGHRHRSRSSRSRSKSPSRRVAETVAAASVAGLAAHETAKRRERKKAEKERQHKWTSPVYDLLTDQKLPLPWIYKHQQPAVSTASAANLLSDPSTPPPGPGLGGAVVAKFSAIEDAAVVAKILDRLEMPRSSGEQGEAGEKRRLRVVYKKRLTEAEMAALEKQWRGIYDDSMEQPVERPRPHWPKGGAALSGAVPTPQKEEKRGKGKKKKQKQKQKQTEGKDPPPLPLPPPADNTTLKITYIPLELRKQRLEQLLADYNLTPSSRVNYHYTRPPGISTGRASITCTAYARFATPAAAARAKTALDGLVLPIEGATDADATATLHAELAENPFAGIDLRLRSRSVRRIAKWTPTPSSTSPHAPDGDDMGFESSDDASLEDVGSGALEVHVAKIRAFEPIKAERIKTAENARARAGGEWTVKDRERVRESEMVMQRARAREGARERAKAMGWEIARPAAIAEEKKRARAKSEEGWTRKDSEREREREMVRGGERGRARAKEWEIAKPAAIAEEKRVRAKSEEGWMKKDRDRELAMARAKEERARAEERQMARARAEEEVAKAGERTSRYSFSSRAATLDDDEPLLFTMSELGTNSRRSLGRRWEGSERGRGLAMARAKGGRARAEERQMARVRAEEEMAKARAEGMARKARGEWMRKDSERESNSDKDDDVDELLHEWTTLYTV